MARIVTHQLGIYFCLYTNNMWYDSFPLNVKSNITSCCQKRYQNETKDFRKQTEFIS